MQETSSDGLTADERRFVRRWTWGLFAFYGVILLSAVTVAILNHGRGSREFASVQAKTAGAGAGNPVR